MRKKALKTIFVCMAVLCLVLATACSGSKSASNHGKTEIKITWRDQGTHDNLRKFLEKDFIPKFEKENPNIKIVLSPIQASEGDYFSKVALMMKSSSTAPDVVAEDSFILNSDANAGYLLNLNKYINSWDQWGQYVDNLKTGVKAQNGNYYAIPGTSDSRGLWYNKAVFKKAGLPDNWQPKNWNDILSAAETIKSKVPDAIPLSMGVAKANGESVSMQTFEMLLYGTNDTLYNTGSKKWVVSSKGINDSLNFIDTVFNKKKLGPPLSIAMNSNYASVLFQDKLPKGKAGIILDGYWNLGNYTPDGAVPLKNVDQVLGFAAMPTQNGQAPGTTTMVGGWTWAIPAKSTHHDTAWKVIAALGSKDNQAKRAISEGNLTVRGDSSKLPEYINRTFIPEATKFLKNGHYRPANDKYPNVSTEIQNMVESVASASTTPAQAANTYKQNVTRIAGTQNTESK